MTNTGKFIDRHPHIIPAGFSLKVDATTADTLKIYNDAEVVESFFKSKCAHEGKVQKLQSVPPLPFIPQPTLGKDIDTLGRSQFQIFRARLKDNDFSRYSKLGKPKLLHAKPADVTNENTLFGKYVEHSEPLYTLIMPKRTRFEVDKDFIASHDKKLFSHQHYWPAERINRQYKKPPYNPNATFGIASRVDKLGEKARNCLEYCDKMVLVTTEQKKFYDRTVGAVGRPTEKQGFNLHPDFTYGDPPIIDCDMHAIIEDLTPCKTDERLSLAVGHLSALRRRIYFRNDINIGVIRTLLEQIDDKKISRLKISTIFNALHSLRVKFDEEKIMTILLHYRIINNDRATDVEIDYYDFLKLLMIEEPLPLIGNMSPIPKTLDNKDTTYRLLCQDNKKMAEYKNLPAMGQKIERKIDDTKVSDLLPPNALVRYSLTKKHFDIKRSKAYLLEIFGNIIEPFDDVWAAAKERLNPTNDMMSVNNLWEQIDLMEIPIKEQKKIIDKCAKDDAKNKSK